ncbi:MAG: hypothetical protein ABMA01_06605 [Chthoniobacteraceae bacterium]
MCTPTDIDPKDLRPLLHAEIDKLRDENVALQLELEEVSARLDTGFDADRAAGKLARLPEIIREARGSLADVEDFREPADPPVASVAPLEL